eukprot:NODE_169_length_14535_cov_0.769881.p2 type:complete len:758 gc:universal NODE_169_length_14535_cov_0.769881:2490-217(-)
MEIRNRIKKWDDQPLNPVDDGIFKRDNLIETPIIQKYAHVDDYDREFYKNLFWVGIYTILGLVTRMYNISASKRVTWDEAHFGKFGSYYLGQSFYFDVHPPLGKMLVSLGMLLSGYTGGFGFESGKEYGDVNYVGMRIFCALFGSALVPLTYLIAKELPITTVSKHLATWCVLCEVGLNVITRFILLDPFLLFFTSLSLYFFIKTLKHPLSIEKFVWMTLLGASLGAVASVKWVGLFFVALVGINTIYELWEYWGDLRMPLQVYGLHWISRIIALIIVPLTVYTIMYVLHFTILTNSGNGDSHMSSLFQAGLKGTDLHRNPLYVAVGSVVTLKNTAYSGGLLHSHPHLYPQGSKQQQITCYHFRDDNNRWQIFPIRHGSKVPEFDGEQPREYNEQQKQNIQYLRHLDEVRLVHKSTDRNLHSHPIAAPVSKWAWEVSAYGNNSFGDSNDVWVFEIVQETKSSGEIDFKEDFDDYPVIGDEPENLNQPGERQRKIKALTTQFRLKHKNSGCYLATHPKALPEWGFKQHEVLCVRENAKDSSVIWNIEHHYNDLLPPGTPRNYKTSLWRDIVHHNVAQWASNNALVADPDKEWDGLVSNAEDWPLMKRGIRMCGWEDNKPKYYMFGNPLVWIPSFFAIVTYIVSLGFYTVRRKRKMSNWKEGTCFLCRRLAKLYNIRAYICFGLHFTLSTFLLDGKGALFAPLLSFSLLQYLCEYFLIRSLFPSKQGRYPQNFRICCGAVIYHCCFCRVLFIFTPRFWI